MIFSGQGIGFEFMINDSAGKSEKNGKLYA
jgi:hypothetical protein